MVFFQFFKVISSCLLYILFDVLVFNFLTFVYMYLTCLDHVWLLTFFLWLEINWTASSVQRECQKYFALFFFVIFFYIYILINHLLKKGDVTEALFSAFSCWVSQYVFGKQSFREYVCVFPRITNYGLNPFSFTQLL